MVLGIYRFLVCLQFNLEWLNEGLPDSYIDVEKIDGHCQIRPYYLLLFVQVPINVEVREISREYWNKIVIPIIYKDEFQPVWNYLYLIRAIYLSINIAP